MSLPSPTLISPTLAVDQASFQGLTFGANTPFEWTAVEGLGKPKVRSGNTPRPRARGSFVGTNLLDVRTITFTLDIGPPFGSYSNLANAVGALRTAASTEGTTEYPLWIQVPNAPLVAAMARVTGFDPKYDFEADIGGTGLGLMKGVPLQFECTDPYFYSAPTGSATVGLPTPGVGFTFPITFPLSFGGGTAANQTTVTNSGDVACWPVFVITGPCLNPSIQNTSITGNPVLFINQQLNAGDRLMIDCDLQSIMFFPSGQTTGAAYPQVLNAGSTFFGLVPGANNLAFNSQDTSSVAGTLAVWNASAFDGIF